MIGTTVSHYRILERLAGGGMGVVYRAEDSRLRRQVALKFLSPELTRDPAAKERFILEARAASSLDHPHVCTIHDIDETADGQVFICMAFYPGETLRERIARGRLELDEALVIAIQIAEGLAAAHAHGIVHRDIKPANVVIAADGTAKILDFGLAQLAGTRDRLAAGLLVGTAPYMSPEQTRGDPVDGRTDIWSLGVTLYEMVAGQPPFRGDQDGPLLQAIQRDQPPSLSEARPDLPAAFCAVVSRCLQKSPHDRFASGDELARELRRIRRATRLSSAPTLTRLPASRHSRRLRALLIGSALAAGGALALLTATGRHFVAAMRSPTATGPVHIAVLPLSSLGSDPADIAFSDGVAEILASKLTSMESTHPAMWVVPVSEVRARAVSSPGEAHRIFGVTLVLTGAVQRLGDRVLVTVSLVDAATLRQTRSELVEAGRDRLELLDGRLSAVLARLVGGEPAPAVRAASAAVPTGVSEAYDLYVQARGALESLHVAPDPARAVELLRRSRSLDPSFAPTHLALVEALLQRYGENRDARLVEEAEASWRCAAELAPTLPAVRVARGRLDTATGRYEQAIAEFGRVLAIEPGNVAVLAALAKAQEMAGSDTDAEATLRRAADLRPDYWLVHNRLGGFLYGRARYTEAEAAYRRVVTIAAENAYGYNNLGAVLLALGRDDEALAMFERAAELRPSATVWSNVGTLRFRMGRFGDAARAFEQAVALDDGDYLLWGNLGSARRWVEGASPPAREALLRAVALAEKVRAVNPREPMVAADLASYRAMLGERAAARALLSPIDAQAWRHADLAFRVGEAWEDSGDRARAIRFIARAIELGTPRQEVEIAPGLRELRADPSFSRALAKSEGQGKETR